MKKKKADTEETGPKGTTRLEIFSDGVFAIAITLLVLELIQFLHPKQGESLFQFYIHHWEPFLAFLIGFLTILVCWINHHHVFQYIIKTDSYLPWVNGFVLLMITFTPLPTAILAEYLGTDGQFAVAAFGFNYLMISIASYWLCAYSLNRYLVEVDKRKFFRFVRLTYGYSIIYTLLAFLVCFVYIPAAIFMYLLLFIAFAFPKEFAERLATGKHKKGRRKAENRDDVQ